MVTTANGKIAKRGITLGEIVITIIIIGILTSVMSSSLWLARTTSNDALRLEQLHQMQVAIKQYYDKHGVYPCGSVQTGNFVGGNEQTDGNWLHTLYDSGSFLDSVPLNSAFPFCGEPSIGMITEGLLPPLKDLGGSFFAYDVTNDRQNYIIYTRFDNAAWQTKAINDGGIRDCFYEVGSGVGNMMPQWLC